MKTCFDLPKQANCSLKDICYLLCDMKQALILDLDDTIFSTQSIDKKIVAPFFETLKESNSVLSKEVFQEAEQALWHTPFHVVAEKYNFTEEMIEKSLAVLETVTSSLNIKPFADYSFLKNLEINQFLVTTGITPYQQNKIESLGIQNDFVAIYIDDPMMESGGKRRLFQQIMEQFSYQASELLVIGDNPSSEIQAGKDLGIETVLIKRGGKSVPHTADFVIDSFIMLEGLL